MSTKHFTNTNEIYLPACDLHRYPANRIPSPQAIDAMRQSIAENGQLQPITARPLLLPDGSTRLEIICGETRALACHAISPTHPVRCYLIELTDQEASKIHAIENFQRKNLDPIEEAQAMENMRANGWNRNAISQTLDIDRKTVDRRLNLLTLDPTIHTAIRENQITLSTADILTTLAPEDRTAALKLCTEPTHSAEPLSQREAARAIQQKIIEPRKRADEWEARGANARRVHPTSTWLPYPEALAANRWDSEYENASQTPAWGYLSEQARHGHIPIPTWGELAAKWKGPTHIALPELGQELCSIRVKTEPLIAAELALYDTDPLACIFQHPSQKKENDLAREKANAAEAAQNTALRQEIRQALLTIARPEAIQPAAAEKLCIEFFKEYHSEFQFSNGQLPGFEDPENLTHEAREKIATSYIKTPSIRGFDALGRLCILSMLDLPACRSTAVSLARLLIQTKAIREKDYPTINHHWKTHNAAQLAADQAKLDQQNQPNQ